MAFPLLIVCGEVTKVGRQFDECRGLKVGIARSLGIDARRLFDFACWTVNLRAIQVEARDLAALMGGRFWQLVGENVEPAIFASIGREPLLVMS